MALSWVHLFCSVRNEILQSPNPREWEREYRPWVDLHRKKSSQILLNCAKLKSVAFFFFLWPARLVFSLCIQCIRGLRGSIMLNFLVRDTKSNFSCRSPRSFIGSPRSLVHLSISFPLLRRPSTVIILLWVACWGEAFHELLMIIVVGSFHSVNADIRSPWSLLFLSNCTPGILISITSVLRSYWSRGWYVRRHPCNKAHHWSRFCCDSFFSWIVLRSFRHCFRAHCRTEMADIEQVQQMIPLITCEIPFG